MNSSKIRYLVVGGYAVGFHGYPRATGDIDIWVDRNIENAKKIVKVLKEFGFTSKEISEDIFLQENKVIRMGVPPLRIEMLTSASGVRFDACYKKRKTIILDNVKINFIDLTSLKANKKKCARPKDLADLENLP